MGAEGEGALARGARGGGGAACPGLWAWDLGCRTRAQPQRQANTGDSRLLLPWNGRSRRKGWGCGGTAAARASGAASQRHVWGLCPALAAPPGHMCGGFWLAGRRSPRCGRPMGPPHWALVTGHGPRVGRGPPGRARTLVPRPQCSRFGDHGPRQREHEARGSSDVGSPHGGGRSYEVVLACGQWRGLDGWLRRGPISPRPAHRRRKQTG